MEEQLIQTQKMEALANLVAGIAHDFKNLLQSILGYTQIAIWNKKEDDPDYETFMKIQNIIEKGGELTQQLLTFGLKAESRFAPQDINRKITEIKGLLLRTMPKMIDIELRLSNDIKTMNGDSSQIEQVLVNLSLNAKDAMPDGGKLVFETEKIVSRNNTFLSSLNAPHGEYVLLSVSDTGCGISKNTLKYLFEPFFTTKENGKGSGLGLFMVYEIIKNHEGFIDCLSKLGEGTTFRIYFPILNVDTARSHNTELDITFELVGGKETILLVDDEADILMAGKKLLEKYGYMVNTARDGEEAIHIYSQNPTDLVILDVGMPGMGGSRCMKELLSFDRKAKVLISSGYSSYHHVKEALELGAKNFLAKPYNIDQLLQMVRMVLDGP